jgi:hypothetical protein
MQLIYLQSGLKLVFTQSIVVLALNFLNCVSLINLEEGINYYL